MDVLELFLDDDDGIAITAKPSEQPKLAPHDDAAFELLMDEFKSAPDPQAQKDALMALLKLTGR
jgi:hypothetical protein